MSSTAAGFSRRRRARPLTGRALFAVKAVVFLLCLAPAAWILTGLFDGRAGPNPVDYLTSETGQWTLRLLLITLAMTPLQRLTWRVEPVRLRRMLGLFTFFYVCLHFLVFSLFDHGFDVIYILEDIRKRPYILVGFLAFVLLIPLAVTSTNRMMKRLGRRWKTLHRLVYVIGALGVLHFLLLVKADTREPLIYGAILLFLLGVRLPLRRLRPRTFRRPDTVG